MALDKNSGKNIVINNATFKWVKLGKPVSPFGTPVWEMSMHLDKKDKQIPELEAEVLCSSKIPREVPCTATSSVRLRRQTVQLTRQW